MIKFLTLRQFICPLSLFLKEIPFASLTNALFQPIKKPVRTLSIFTSMAFVKDALIGAEPIETTLDKNAMILFTTLARLVSSIEKEILIWEMENSKEEDKLFSQSKSLLELSQFSYLCRLSRMQMGLI